MRHNGKVQNQLTFLPSANDTEDIYVLQLFNNRCNQGVFTVLLVY